VSSKSVLFSIDIYPTGFKTETPDIHNILFL